MYTILVWITNNVYLYRQAVGMVKTAGGSHRKDGFIKAPYI